MVELSSMKQFRFLTPITALFVTVLLVSNIASSKLTGFWGLTLDAGTILFPLAYIFGDILTEVYGYATSRRVIWTGFACLTLASVVFMVVQYLPPAADWTNQLAYEAILGLTPRIVLASLCAYLVGEFANSYVLAKMKVAMAGKRLWMRTIGSTLVGEFFDSVIFVSIAFGGVYALPVLTVIIFSNYIFKVVVEVVFTPVTYKIVALLKRLEGVDFYDTRTRFTPLRW